MPIVSSKSCEILNIAPSAAAVLPALLLLPLCTPAHTRSQTHTERAREREKERERKRERRERERETEPRVQRHREAQALLGGDPRSQVLVAQRQQIVDETQARAAEQKAWKCLKNSAGAAARQ